MWDGGGEGEGIVWMGRVRQRTGGSPPASLAGFYSITGGRLSSAAVLIR